jgi:hypothetical protein
MIKKGDVVRFNKERIQKAKDRSKYRARIQPKWDNFVLTNINTPLIVKYVEQKRGNIDTHTLVIVEGMRGYWNEDVFEPYNNFDEDLFTL